MAIEKTLDARELEAPLPLEYAIKIARNLKHGEYLKMSHRMHPCKLDAVLEKMDISSCYFEQNGEHLVFGWLKSDNETKKYIQNRINNEYGGIIAI